MKNAPYPNQPYPTQSPAYGSNWQISNYEPSWRERLQAMIKDYSARAGLGPITSSKVADRATLIADMLPGAGDALAVDDLGRSYEAGDKIGMGINAAAVGLGVMPVVGDVAGKGVKAAAKKLAVGAPRGVKTAQKAASIRNKYLALMSEGAPYADWYDRAGEANLFHAGGDPTLAAKFTGAQAVSSANTKVDQNLGHAIKAHNHRMVGRPAEAGRFKAWNKKIDKVYDAHSPAEVFDTLGDKIGPYAENIAKGGDYAQTNQGRAVHDIWDARNWGYSEKEIAGGMSSPQHRYQDDQMRKVLDLANKRKLAGRSDWDERSAQAASWIAKKARTEGTTTAAAGRSYPEFMSKYYGQAGYESVPGKTTDHLAALRSAPMDVRQSHMDRVADIMTDEQGRDKLSLAFGGLTGKTFAGPGLFEGSVNPGRQTQVLLGRAMGGKAIDPASAEMMNAIEASRAMVLGQDAAGYHLKGNAGEALINTGIVDADLGGPIGNEQFMSLWDKMQDTFKGGKTPKGGELPSSAAMGITATPAGARMLDFSGGGAEFAKGARSIAKELGMGDVQTYRMIGSNLIENDWSVSRAGQEYLKFIDRPEFIKAFDSVVPVLAKKLYELDATIAKAFGDVGHSQIQKLRQVVAEGGYQGLRDAIAKGALSVGAVGIMLHVMNGPEKNNQGT